MDTMAHDTHLIVPPTPIGSRASVAMLGALGSLLVHVLLVAPVLFGGAHRVTHTSPIPPVEEGGDGLSEDSSITLAPAEDPDEASMQESRSRPAVRLSTISPAVLAAAVTPPSLDVAGDERDEASTSDVSGPDPMDAAERAALYGRYLGQIAARVERAWLRPRSSVGDPSFTCTARVRQGADVHVIEVELQRCNGDARWQLSVVQAIESASPLPAPPDPRVFTRSVVVALEAEPFRPGMGSDGYESESAIAARIGEQRAGSGVR